MRDMLLWFALLLAIPVILVVVLAIFGVTLPVGRFLSGAPLWGGDLNDSTFTRHPSHAKHPKGKRKWHWRPGWHRAAVRVAAVYAFEFVVAGLFLATWVVIVVLAILAAAALAWPVLWVKRKVCRWWPSISK